MRFESKNKELKDYTTYCFKNVPYSVSVRHQQTLCYRLAVRPGETSSSFLYAGDEVVGGKLLYNAPSCHFMVQLEGTLFHCSNIYILI